MIAQSFVPLLLAQRPPDSDNPRMVRQVSTPFLSRIGLRVMSESFSVSDTPSLQQFAGRPVPGAYEVDDEGVPAQDVPLVENGRLVMLLTNRTPNRNLPESNGHAAATGRRPAWCRCAARGQIPAAEMKAKTLELLRLQNKEFGYIVRSIDAQASPLIVKVTPDGSRADRSRREHRRRAAVGFPRHPRSLVRADASTRIAPAAARSR